MKWMNNLVKGISIGRWRLTACTKSDTTIKPALSNHMKQLKNLGYRENSCKSFLHYFKHALSCHLLDGDQLILWFDGRLTQVLLYVTTYSFYTNIRYTKLYYLIVTLDIKFVSQALRLRVLFKLVSTSWHIIPYTVFSQSCIQDFNEYFNECITALHSFI